MCVHAHKLREEQSKDKSKKNQEMGNQNIIEKFKNSKAGPLQKLIT